MNDTLRLMGRGPSDRLTKEVAREICQRTTSTAMLAGSIAQVGERYSLVLKAVNCATGESLASVDGQASDKNHVLDALGKVATSMREKLGESLTTIEKYDKPLEEATTSSLEALKVYSEAQIARRSTGDTAAIPLLKRAIELDPNFASAYVGLGVSYSNLGEIGLSNANLQKAYELRDRVNEREKYRITADYYMFCKGDLNQAEQTFSLWARAYPHDATPELNLGVVYQNLAQYQKSLDASLIGMKLTPGNGVVYGNIVGNYIALNRLDEAKNAYQDAIARHIGEEIVVLHANRYWLAFLENDTAEMDRQTAWARGKPGADDFMSAIASDTEAYHGRLAKARELSKRASDYDLHNDQKETAALWDELAALHEAEFGYPEKARALADSGLALARTHDTEVLAALALAIAGDGARAEKMADELAKAYPDDTLVEFYWLPMVRAAIDISRKNAAKAVEELKAVAPYDLAAPSPAVGVNATLLPNYLRGEAYLIAGNGAAAAAEFQKIIDYKYLIGNYPVGALAHLGLGRAYALQGDASKARTAYQDFLALWKDADADVPVLIGARAEYAKIK